MERRLAAILAADIVGYSRLMGADEELTLAGLRSLRTEVVEPRVTEHGGRVVKHLGDGFLAEFPSASPALTAARLIQSEMSRRNHDVPEERRIRLRIGINQGEIVVEGGDIFGDSVNVAARLEGLSPPEGVAVSDTVHAEAAGRSELAFEDIGTQSLKNIVRPIRVWCARIGGDEASPASGAPAQVASRTALTVAVLPFRNLSGAEEQDYLADGISEDISDSLARFSSLSVVGPTATAAFRDADRRDLGRDLGARYVLEGSVRRAGARVRVAAQLTDAGAGNRIWTERYDRTLEDIFDLQDEISQTIAARIEPELAHAERERSLRKSTTDLGAWDRYQRGMWHLYRFTPRDAAAARENFSAAIAADPGFGAAHAGLAYQLCYDVWNGYAEDRAATLAAAERHVRRALELDDRDVRARFTFGRVLQIKRDYPGAIREFESGIDLSPSFAQMHHGLGFARVFGGDAEAALPCFERAIRLSPHDPQLQSFLFARAFAHLSLGQHEKAVASAEAAIAQPNAMVWGHVYRTSGLGHLGSPKVFEALAELRELAPELSCADLRKRLFFADCDAYLDHLVAGLLLAGLPE